MYQPQARNVLCALLRRISHEDRQILVRSQSVLKPKPEVSQLLLDGIAGKRFAKALSFYLDCSEEYLNVVETDGTYPQLHHLGCFYSGDFMSFRTYAEINLDNLAHNIGCIRDKVAPSGLIPVIKADAYGHGAAPVAKRLAREGCAMFAVARLEEGMELRESGISQRILILGRLFPDDIEQALGAGLTISIFGDEDLDWIEKACAHSVRASPLRCISNSIQEWEELGFFCTGRPICSTGW